MASVIPGVGEFTKKVMFRTPQKSPYPATYVDLIEVWACVRFKSGDRAYSESIDTVVSMYDIFVYYQSEIANLLRDTLIRYEGNDYSINSTELIGEEKRFYKYEVVGAK